MKTMTSALAAAACFAAILPASAFAAPKAVKKTAAPTIYECVKCHMKVSAAVAKKDHYKDPMDGGALKPVKSALKTSSRKSAAKHSKAKSASMKSLGM